MIRSVEDQPTEAGQLCNRPEIFFSSGQATSGRARAAPARAASPDSKITEKANRTERPAARGFGHLARFNRPSAGVQKRDVGRRAVRQSGGILRGSYHGRLMGGES